MSRSWLTAERILGTSGWRAPRPIVDSADASVIVAPRPLGIGEPRTPEPQLESLTVVDRLPIEAELGRIHETIERMYADRDEAQGFTTEEFQRYQRLVERENDLRLALRRTGQADENKDA